VEEVRRPYGDHAAVVAEKLAARDTETTWGKGSDGESRLARWIEKEVGDYVIAPHDKSLPDVPIYGALCFVESEWRLTDFPFNVGKAWVCFPGALRKALKKKGPPLSRETMEHVARRLGPPRLKPVADVPLQLRAGWRIGASQVPPGAAGQPPRGLAGLGYLGRAPDRRVRQERDLTNSDYQARSLRNRRLELSRRRSRVRVASLRQHRTGTSRTGS
jgi:hypothetical protein